MKIRHRRKAVLRGSSGKQAICRRQRRNLLLSERLQTVEEAQVRVRGIALGIAAAEIYGAVLLLCQKIGVGLRHAGRGGENRKGAAAVFAQCGNAFSVFCGEAKEGVEILFAQSAGLQFAKQDRIAILQLIQRAVARKIICGGLVGVGTIGILSVGILCGGDPIGARRIGRGAAAGRKGNKSGKAAKGNKQREAACFFAKRHGGHILSGFASDCVFFMIP